ncbi:hypothetical protein JXA85_05475 [Candidatus Woesearchaeota archaeon]|nr:hypothetical protein [Candidatus Woesearchaeota archaeon]
MTEGLGVLLKKHKPDIIQYVRMRWNERNVANKEKRIEKYDALLTTNLTHHDLRSLSKNLKLENKNAKGVVRAHHISAILNLAVFLWDVDEFKKFGRLIYKGEITDEKQLKIFENQGFKKQHVKEAAEIIEDIKKGMKTFKELRRKYKIKDNEVNDTLKGVQKIVNGLLEVANGRTDFAKFVKSFTFADNRMLWKIRVRYLASAEFRYARQEHKSLKHLETTEAFFFKVLEHIKADENKTPQRKFEKANMKKLEEHKKELETAMRKLFKEGDKFLDTCPAVIKDGANQLILDSFIMRRIVHMLKMDLVREKEADSQHEIPDVMFKLDYEKKAEVFRYLKEGLQDERKSILQIEAEAAKAAIPR